MIVSVPHGVVGVMVVEPDLVPEVVMVVVASVQVVMITLSVPHEVAGGIVVVPGFVPEVMMVIVASVQVVVQEVVVVQGLVQWGVHAGASTAVVEVVDVEVEHEVEVELDQSDPQLSHWWSGLRP